MNYELAKKLKDAGFPFKPVGEHFNAGGKATQAFTFDNQSVWFEPTLSELIEACGNEFAFVCRGYDQELWLDSWGAESTNGKVITGASVPEEAVAKLWLELNKNANTPDKEIS